METIFKYPCQLKRISRSNLCLQEIEPTKQQVPQQQEDKAIPPNPTVPTPKTQPAPEEEKVAPPEKPEEELKEVKKSKKIDHYYFR